jgi:hypothetical protein
VFILLRIQETWNPGTSEMDPDKLRERIRSLMRVNTGRGDGRKWKKPRGKMEGVEKGAVLGAGIGAAAGTGLGYAERYRALHKVIRDLQSRNRVYSLPFSLGVLDNLPVSGLSGVEKAKSTAVNSVQYLKDLAAMNRNLEKYPWIQQGMTDTGPSKHSVRLRGMQGAGAGAGLGVGIALLSSLLDRKLADRLRK